MSFDEFVVRIASDLGVPIDLAFPPETMDVTREAYDALVQRLDSSRPAAPSSIEGTRDIDVYIQLCGPDKKPFGEPLDPFRMQAVPADVVEELLDLDKEGV